MRLKIILLIVLFFSVASKAKADSPVVSQKLDNSYSIEMGESFQGDKVEFVIKWAEVGRWIENWSADLAHNRNPDDAIYEKKDMISFHYELRNTDQNKKLDLSWGVQHTLSDEFGNQYRPLKKPKDYSKLTKFKPPHFPSVYPNETYAETVFFEAPIKTSRELLLSVSIDQLELAGPITIKVPIEKVQKTVELAAAEQKRIKEKQALEVLPKSPSMESSTFSITFPRDGISVRPGSVVHLSVELAEGSLAPNMIYVVSPMYVLEDDIPAYSYNLMVPKDQPKGELTIVVIGKWTDEDKEHYVSDSITFDVLDPKERCVENCISNRS